MLSDFRGDNNVIIKHKSLIKKAILLGHISLIILFINILSMKITKPGIIMIQIVYIVYGFIDVLKIKTKTCFVCIIKDF